jgi:predicted DNA-binding protein (MmcQ/YjbR family)
MNSPALLRVLRSLAKRLPEASEGTSFGHAAFRAGKRPFAVLDHYRGVDCLCVQLDRRERARRLRDPRYFETPYDRTKTWVGLPFDRIASAAEVRELALQSYHFLRYPSKKPAGAAPRRK